ncbi:Pre protein translocase subunit Sec66-domain-containing protein [Geranomyces variabilis]|nr:Pre protein translocase subunit Sec66-domain-containing protein [Geranomyces variabilis]KAJ3133376.1 translocation protein S66 [Geranomyces variabilis]
MTSATAAFWFPVLYLTGVGLLFTAYITWNRAKARVAVQHAHDDGYFPPHTSRTQYNELAEMFSPEDPNGLKLLMTSLMKRALTDVQRVFHINEEKAPLQALVNKGTVGEDLLEKLVAAEADLQSEINEVMEEAEMYRPGWGKTIFQEASQMVQMSAQQEAQRIAQEQQAEIQERARAAAQAEAESPTSESDLGSPASVASGATPTSQTASATSLTSETEEERRQRLADELLREEEAEKKRAAKAASKAAAKNVAGGAGSGSAGKGGSKGKKKK